MKKITLTVAAALTMGSLATGSLGMAAYAPAPHASPTAGIVDTPTSVPTLRLLACDGTTGSEGCGPGWHWQWQGPRGQACYPC
jgi:hypothetical protein